ncbi:translation initiation factor eIF2B subunit gamma-like [Ornithodoros turicata]|uniref:translation initiation factor eIF2B subunit gamma-like n=1 Tax=Ornithodoros turicata TaxID=34597 RepID=UPI00313A0C9C
MIDFQAVLMAAGRGSRLAELLSPDCPKYLLPVGNLPMIYYPLCALKRAGFRDVIVIVPNSNRYKIDETLSEKVGIRIEYVPVPASEDDLGTVESLRLVRDKLKKDVFVVSCDLVTDFDLGRLAEVHRTNNAALTALFAPMSPTLKESPVPGSRGKPKLEKDIVGLEPKTDRLVLFNSEADFEEIVSVRRSVLRRHPVIDVRSDLVDAHAYVLSRWLLPWLIANKNIMTVKGELVPLVTKLQFHADPLKQQKYQKQDDDLPETSIFRFVPKPPELGPIESCYTLRQDEAEPIRCFGVVARDEFLVRANTTAGYVEANRKAHQLDTTIFSQVAVGRFDNVMGDQVSLGEKANVRQSVIGARCRIGAKATVQSSVLMDDTCVGDGASVVGSVVCGTLEVGQGSQLQNCVVCHKKNLPSGVRHANEVLGSFVEL